MPKSDCESKYHHYERSIASNYLPAYSTDMIIYR